MLSNKNDIHVMHTVQSIALLVAWVFIVRHQGVGLPKGGYAFFEG